MNTHIRRLRCGGVPSKSGAHADRAHLDFSAGIPAAGAAREKARAPRPHAEAGSAMLIVLGFLSFMMISAVSFAVYMRIERQASSNYRHAVTARHLLNAGLYRAIDDVDAELGTERKFPEWQGRVFVSGQGNINTNNSPVTRVLSLESLSLIPGIFVNDVRKYALSAKWGTISMPSTLAGLNNQVGIGRYAFVCVNLSDMLDVNLCKAAFRDATTNRVSIGHLFDTGKAAADQTACEKFDEEYGKTDRHYESLEDFYSCLYHRRQDTDPQTCNTRGVDTPFGSAYHSFIKAQNDEFFDWAFNHVLVTDSIVKPEPPKANVVGVPCNILKDQPVAAGLLTQARPATIALQPEFQTALGNALPGGLPGSMPELTATMIADYLDEDSIPKRLNMPSVERVPMISQILVPGFFAPTVIKRDVTVGSGPTATTKSIYSVQLIGEPTAMQLDVELVWPFKPQKDRTPQPGFKVELQAYLKVIKQHAPQKSRSFAEPPTPTYALLTGSVAIPDFWNKDTSDPVNCYNHVLVPLTASDPSKLIVDMIDSEDGVIPNSGFVEHQKFSVALVVFVHVKAGADIVDSAPQMSPYPGFSDPIAEFIATPKLFFQTKESAPVEKTMAVKLPIPYEWSSLEVPDPRFNYKAANWVKNTVDANAIAPKINPSTVELLGKAGRDSDIYMAVSDVGTLQSPGELGFIVRPFALNAYGIKDTDFRTQNTAAESEDNEDMFRTIRLYDHGQAHLRDNIYDYFTVRNPDGTVPGARVNPLSDLPQVLVAAVENTPTDYYWAGAKLVAGGGPPPATVRQYVFNKVLGKPSWEAFTNGWSRCMLAAKNPPSTLNTSVDTHLSDVYGSWDKFKWYSEDQARTGIFGVDLGSPLHEIDRKMLYSFSLESMSDRQQLFLYVVRAEVTVPFFGGAAGSGVKSLAGGRAAALVWRDPYPDPSLADYHPHRILFFKQMDN
ncbi:MAG: hypothetical protein WCK89_12270 [bacterium]